MCAVRELPTWVCRLVPIIDSVVDLAVLFHPVHCAGVHVGFGFLVALLMMVLADLYVSSFVVCLAWPPWTWPVAFFIRVLFALCARRWIVPAPTSIGFTRYLSRLVVLRMMALATNPCNRPLMPAVPMLLLPQSRGFTLLLMAGRLDPPDVP